MVGLISDIARGQLKCWPKINFGTLTRVILILILILININSKRTTTGIKMSGHLYITKIIVDIVTFVVI